MRQILLNLIGNAIKFAHGGSIAVTIAWEPSGDGKHVMRASVRDSGIGIHPDRTETIFQAFVQAEVTTTRRFGGSGLGLSISRQLAEMMDGTIEVVSVLNQGTVMTLVLPLVESSAPEIPDSTEIAGYPREALPVDTTSRPASILMVEDVDINQELFSEMLTRLGHRFVIAADGAEAVELAKRLGPEPDAWDLILMDLQMPVMDGLTATRAIRALGDRAASIPIIALTASAFEKERQQCTAAGMNDHLAKPVGIEALRRMINRWSGSTDLAAGEKSAFVHSPSLDRRIRERLQSSAVRLAEIVEAVSAAGPDDRGPLMAEAGKLAHLLAGTAGLVGEDAVGDLAAATEATIATWIGDESASAMAAARAAIEGLVAAVGATDLADQSWRIRNA